MHFESGKQADVYIRYRTDPELAPFQDHFTHEIDVSVLIHIYRTLALLRPLRCYAPPPPPLFSAKLFQKGGRNNARVRYILC